MSMAARSTRAEVAAIALLAGTFVSSDAVHAAAVLRAARADIRVTSPTTCEVTLELTVDGATEVSHRLDVRAGTSVDLDGVDGAAIVAPPSDAGQTKALTVRSSGAPYTLRYHVRVPDTRAYHCPVWLPAVPADGRSRAVEMRVTLPGGATAASTMPTFRWTGATGAATVGHLPAFVIVPFAAAGAPRQWDVSRVMDGLALGTLVVGTLIWLRRSRMRPRRAPRSGESPA